MAPKKPTKFAFLQGEPLPEQIEERNPTPEPEPKPVPAPPIAPAVPAPPLAPTPIEAVPKRGRATGKRSDPNYTQVGAYIPKELYKRVKRRLVDEDLDVSDLIADLLGKWLGDKPDNQ